MRKCWVYLGTANGPMKLEHQIRETGEGRDTWEIRLGKEDGAFECQAREVGLYQNLPGKRMHH